MRLRVPLILASASPRRRHLLAQLGVSFEVHPSPVDESYPYHLAPNLAVAETALQKAQSLRAVYRNALILGADTVVVLDGTVLGKPNGPREAKSMLRRLSDRWHEVFTGVALIHPASDRRQTVSQCTRVRFAKLSDAEIERYVANGSPLDKAGAYGIQDDFGSVFVTGIEGDFYTVVGLPLSTLYSVVRAEFSDLLAEL